VAIVVQVAVRMRHIILLSVAFRTVPYFPTSRKWYDFRGGKSLLGIKSVF